MRQPELCPLKEEEADAEASGTRHAFQPRCVPATSRPPGVNARLAFVWGGGGGVLQGHRQGSAPETSFPQRRPRGAAGRFAARARLCPGSHDWSHAQHGKRRVNYMPAAEEPKINAWAVAKRRSKDLASEHFFWQHLYLFLCAGGKKSDLGKKYAA